MQLESQHIYKGVASRHNLKAELVKSIGDAVFQSFSDLQRDPPNLILDLKGIGRRFLRRKKINDRIDTLIRMREGIVAGRHYRKEVKEIEDEIKHLRILLDWYDEFTAKRNYIKTLRHEYPSPLESAVQPEGVHPAGDGDQGEHQRVPAGEPAVDPL